MRHRKQIARSRQAGFSLLELLIAVAILVIVIGSVMGQVTAIQKRSQAEASKMDVVQQAREAMDQFTRDLHQAGYPARALIDPTPGGGGPTDTHVALRLVKISSTEVWFEGDVDGSGTVSAVRYRWVPTGGHAECMQGPCLLRMQSQKLPLDPLAMPTDYHVLVENATNFTISAFDQNGNAVPLGAPLTWNVNPVNLLGPAIQPGDQMIRTIAATLTVQAQTVDLASKIRPSLTFNTIVELKN